MTVIVNKHVWIHCFGKEVPSEEQLVADIQQLRKQLLILDSRSYSLKKKRRSELQNSLKRHHKMLAAVKDGQPWAWMLYPSSGEINTVAKLG